MNTGRAGNDDRPPQDSKGAGFPGNLQILDSGSLVSVVDGKIVGRIGLYFGCCRLIDMANMVHVNPDLIRWAVDRSGLQLEDFPSAVKDWIDQKKQPTFNMLQNFASKARVPFGYLFLDRPPVETIPIPDYRTIRDKRVQRPSPDLIDTIQDMQLRQAWMREFLLEEGHAPLPYVNSESTKSSVEELVGSLRR